MPPVAENKTFFQLLAEDGERLRGGIPIVGKRGVGDSRGGGNGEKTGFVATGGKVDVLRELAKEKWL